MASEVIYYSLINLLFVYLISIETLLNMFIYDKFSWKFVCFPAKSK